MRSAIKVVENVIFNSVSRLLTSSIYSSNRKAFFLFFCAAVINNISLTRGQGRLLPARIRLLANWRAEGSSA